MIVWARGLSSDTSSEALTFVAWETEYYILNVYSYEGSGDYTLDIEIVETISLDDGDNYTVINSEIYYPDWFSGEFKEQVISDLKTIIYSMIIKNF